MPSVSFTVSQGDLTLGAITYNQTTRRWDFLAFGKVYGFRSPEDAALALELMHDATTPAF